jgi:hypothetical protein
MTALATPREPEIVPEATPRRWLPPALLVVAAAVWVLFVAPVDPARLDSFGLVRALHPGVLAAIALLSVGFVLELRTPAPRTWLLFGAGVLAVAGIYGLPTVVEPVARLPVAWLHAGWSEYIADNGRLLHGFDARFSWPAFFALAGWIAEVAGVDATALLGWAPPVFTGLAAIGVYAVARAVLGSHARRAAWLAAWLFLMTNWVEQDYFSPQALAFLMYAAALAITFRWLLRTATDAVVPSVETTMPFVERQPTHGDWRGGAEPDRPHRTFAAAVALALIACALAPAHQVTPFALGAVLLVLAVSGKLRHRWLLAIVVLAPLTWLVLGAADYWTTQLDTLTGGIGDLSGSVKENVGARVTGSTGRMGILAVRFGLVGLLLVLAFAGWWRLRRPWPLGIAALIPFGLVALQSYGGEMLLRSFLYALPLLCTLGGAALAGALHPVHGKHELPRMGATPWVAALLAAMSVAVVTARGGNDGYVAFRTEDVAIVEEAYRLTEPGTQIASLTAYLPLRYDRVGEVKQDSLERVCPPSPRMGHCVIEQGPATVVVTKAQDNYGVLMLGLRPGWSREVIKELVRMGSYRERARAGDAVLLIREGNQGGGAP